MKQLVFLSLLVLSLPREGASTHLETCDCHEIKDIVNATVQEAIAGLEDKLNTLIAKNSEKTSTELESTLSATIKSALRPIKAQLNYHLPAPQSGTSEGDPAASCKELKHMYPDATSGYYWVKAGEDGAPVKVYCKMSLTCGGVTGGWMKVADLDMRDTSQSCPSGFFYRSSPKRVCDITSNGGCVSEEYSVHDIQYNHVCGRVIGYQFRTTLAFTYFNSVSNNPIFNDINGRYVHGVSLTHGSVNHRSHIWTFAGSSDETTSSPTFKCPCINTNIQQPSRVPSFIGSDYFCDTAQSSHYDNRAVLHPSDPLWDGQGCGPTNACCNFPSDQVKPPWFYKHLSQGTTDDIEMRLCRQDSNGSTPIEIVELYVQ